MNLITLRLVATVISVAAAAASCQAQITAPTTPVGGTRVATFQEVLVTNLRAVRSEQQEFLLCVDRVVTAGKLDPALAMAIMRYSQRRNPAYPFPYFERAMRYEAAKRGVYLPAVAVIASTAAPHRR